MKSNAERIYTQQRMDETESSSKNTSFRLSSSSTADSSFDNLSCSCYPDGCTDCDYGDWKEVRMWKKNPPFSRKKKHLRPRFLPHEKKSLKTNKVSKKTVAKSKSELFKNYCPYSSDNCACSSGCTNCDYGLYTYTIKNKSKVKSEGKKLYIKSSNGFRPLKTSERTAKSFNTMNILKKKKARSPKMEKTVESCHPKSPSSCDCKSGYIKRDFELYATKDRILKTKKKTSARNSRKLKTTTNARTLKLLNSTNVSKNVVAKVAERDLTNWFPDSSNSYDYNTDCTDRGKHVTTKRKKLKNRSERTRASMKSEISELCSVSDESVKNKKDSKQAVKIFHKRPLSWPSCDYSESDS